MDFLHYRISTPYVLNYYLPSGLFVLVSWTSYAIPVKAIPGRVALIMTTFLSLVNIANSAFESSPSNQGINLMQVLYPEYTYVVRITAV